jgi:TP901 family phage tail tape measure protein
MVLTTGSTLSVGGKFKSLGVDITELIAPLVGMEGAAVAAGEAMENAFNTIIRSTGAAGESLEGLKGSFETVFGSVAVSSQDAAQAISNLSVILGETGEPLELLTEKMVQLSKFTGTDLQANVEGIARLFNDWHIATDDQANSLDKLFTVFQKTGTTVTTLTSTLTQNGAAFRQLGLDLDQASVLVGKLGQTTGNVDAIMAGLRKTIATLAKAGQDVPTAFAGIIDTLQHTEDATQGLTLTAAAFGPKGAAAMFDAIRAGKIDLQDFAGVLDGATGALQRAADATPTLTGALVLLKNNVTLALAPLGETIVTALTGWVKDLDPVVNELHDLGQSFNELSPFAKQFAVDIAGIGIAAAGGLVGLRAFLGVMGKVGEIATIGLTAITDVSTVIYAIGTGTTEALLPAEATILGIGEALTGIGIAAVGAYASFKAFGDLSDNFKTLSDQMSTTEDVVKDFIGQFVDFKDLKSLVSELGGAFEEMVDPIGKAVSSLLDSLGIADKFKDGWKSVTGALADITWWSVIAAPITALNQAVKVLSEALVLATGHSAEMDKATQQMSAGLEDWVNNLNHGVAELMLADTTAAQVNISFRDMASLVGISLPKGFDATAQSAEAWINTLKGVKPVVDTFAEDFARAWALVLDQQAAMEKFADELPAKLATLSAAEGKATTDLAITFAKSLQAMHDTAVQQVDITASVFSQLPDKLKGPIQQVYDDVTALNKDFATLGVETDEQSTSKVQAVKASALAIEQAYIEGWKNLKGDYLISSAEMLNAQIAADQVTLNEAHRTGQAVSDDFVHNLDRMKAAAVANSLDIDQAFSAIGSKSSAQWGLLAGLADTAFKKISDDAVSSAGDVDRAMLNLLQTQAAAIQSTGATVSQATVRQIADLQQKIKDGNVGLLVEMDKFTSAVGDDFAKMSDQAILNFMTGQGSLGQVWDSFLNNLAADFMKIFIAPITHAIANLIAGSLAALIGGQGFGGVEAAANRAGAAIAKAFNPGAAPVSAAGAAGTAGSAAKAAVPDPFADYIRGTTTATPATGIPISGGGTNPFFGGSAASGPSDLPEGAPTGLYGGPTIGTPTDSLISDDALRGITSPAGSATGASSAGSASSLLSSLGSLTNVIGLVGVGVQAISGIVSGVQQAHANSLLDKIEKSTRGALNVLATNGSDSILAFTGATEQRAAETRDRVIDIRSALFDPVAKDLEAIWTELNDVLLPAINMISGGVGATVAAVGAGSQTVAAGTQDVVDGLDQVTQQVSAGIDTAAAMNADGQSNLAADLAQSNATAAGEAATTYGEASQTVASAVTGSGDQITSAVLDTGGMTAAALGDLGATLSDSYDSIKAGLIGQPVAPNPNDVAANNKDLLSGNPYGVLNPDGSARNVTPDYTEKGLNNPTTPYTPAPYTPPSTNSYTGAPGAGSVGGGFTTHTGALPTTPTPYTPLGSGVAGPTQFTGGGAFSITPYTGLPAPYTPASTNSYTGAPSAGSVGGFTDEFSAPTGSQLTSAATNNALNQYLAKGGTLTGYYSGAPLPSAPPTPAPGANQYGEVNPYENEYAPGIPVTKNNGPIPNNITIQMNNGVFSNQAAFEQFNAQLATTLRQNLPS